MINPAQPDLHLSAETFQEWLRRTSVKADGTPRRDLDNLILSVKAFYLDLSAWAVAEPERWGMWAAPNPVPHTLTRGYGARARKRTELVHARVRTLQPLLAVLVEHVDADLVSARKLLTRVKEVQPGEEFTCDGRRYRRPWTRHDQQHTLWDGEAPLRCHDAETGEAVNAGLREDEAFWTWAIVHHVEPAAGLCGGRGAVPPDPPVVGEDPLSAALVDVGAAQEAGAGDVHADQDQGDVEVHQLADQVEGVLVVLAVEPEPGDVVDQQGGGVMVPDRVPHCSDQVVQGSG
ncbi:hypothetical protein AB0Q97_26260, partial [Streptomyces sp. NPDC088135]